MKFNINEMVKVRLTDYGKRMLKKDFEEFWGSVNSPYAKKQVWEAPKEDEDGWSRWQMWCLMKDLGSYVGMAKENPFELEIEIVENGK